MVALGSYTGAHPNSPEATMRGHLCSVFCGGVQTMALVFDWTSLRPTFSIVWKSIAIPGKVFGMLQMCVVPALNSNHTKSYHSTSCHGPGAP